MRLIPALAIAAALMSPAIASAACDQAELQKLSTEMMTAAQAFGAKNPSVEAQQAMQKKMMDISQEMQTKAATNPEEVCKSLQTIIDELKK